MRLDVRRSRAAPEVKGARYSYHAWLYASSRQLIRYDMSHHWLGLHCHLFDSTTGEEEVFTHLPIEMLPSLDGFIRIADRMAEAVQSGQ